MRSILQANAGLSTTTANTVCHQCVVIGIFIHLLDLKPAGYLILDDVLVELLVSNQPDQTPIEAVKSVNTFYARSARYTIQWKLAMTHAYIRHHSSQ